MAHRDSHAEDQIPTGVQDVPYPSHYDIARKYMARVGEAMMTSVLGAGGAGGSTAKLPFEPAFCFIFNATAPGAWCAYKNASGTVVNQDLEDAAVVAGVVFGADGDGDPIITLPVALAANGVTVTVIAFGVRGEAPGH